MITLLCTTGQSPAIVIEAYLLCQPLPESVHCITTDSERTPSLSLHAYFNEAKVAFTCARVAGLGDLKDGSDQALFDEVLYRWYLSHRQGADHLQVCLAGGFKTMSASMQQAAGYFGAEGLFHVLAEANPALEQVSDELAAGRIHRIDLPATEGWRPLRTLRAGDFLLVVDVREDDQYVRPEGEPLALIETIRAECSRMMGRGQAEVLAFPALALWPKHERVWLNDRLDGQADGAWVRALPKVELHCHLGGFASDGVLLDEVRASAAKPAELKEKMRIPSPSGWPLPAAPVKLDDYMGLGDNTGSALMRDSGCLQRQCTLLYHHLLDEGVVYAEIRCSPNNYATPERSAWDVLQMIQRTFQSCMEKSGEAACHVNLIVIATRREGGDLSAISKHLALAVTAAQHFSDSTQCQVVGVDLAGFESEKTRPAYFREQFSGVHRCGLAVTVHAGENDDAESIWQAVYELHARRLGHALHLFQARDLLRTVIDRRIGVEMCPYANYQINGFEPMPGSEAVYPLLDYMRAGVMVTANTDNIGISGASLSKNLLFLSTLCPAFRRCDVVQLQRNALETAFVSNDLRVRLRQRIESRLLEAAP